MRPVDARHALISALLLCLPATTAMAQTFEPASQADLEKLHQLLRPEAPTFKWDVPGIIATVQMPGIVEVDGVPVKTHAVVVKGDFASLVRHFLDSFIAQGLYVAPMDEQPQPPKGAQLTGFDPFSEISYTVMFQGNPDKTITLILGEANIGARRPASVDGIPLLPGAQNVQQTRSEDLRTVSFSTARPLDAGVKEYLLQLERAGFQQKSPGEFRRGREELRLVAAAKDGTAHFLLSLPTLPPNEEP
jgi:hypothetical protein